MSMDIKTWMKTADAERKAEVATRAGTSVDYLYQLGGGHRLPSVEMARRLRTASDGEMTLAGLRPDIWGAGEAA